MGPRPDPDPLGLQVSKPVSGRGHVSTRPEVGRGFLSQATVWPHRVVLPLPPLDQDLCFRQRVEDFAVQQFVAQFPVERFDIPVLPWTARLDEQRLHVQGGEPQPHVGIAKCMTAAFMRTSSAQAYAAVLRDGASLPRPRGRRQCWR